MDVVRPNLGKAFRGSGGWGVGRWVVHRCIQWYGYGRSVGVDVLAGKVGDLKSVVLEPMKVKKQAMSSATETARLVLRIDDIISSKGRGGAGPGGPGGMGGMPEMD
jgi:hypothetical protein